MPTGDEYHLDEIVEFDAEIGKWRKSASWPVGTEQIERS